MISINHMLKSKKIKSKEEATKNMPNLLFLKGKSYYSEIIELGKNKKISFEEYPSITDKDGRILYISKVDNLNIEND